jgi:acyl-coenzyme A synthetase/AMP-(fatty) acid ligase/acyl carrier protein
VREGWQDEQGASSLPDRFFRHARLDPDRPAIVGDRKPLTYAELAGLAHASAVALGSRIHVPGGRVALLLDHGADPVAATIGALTCRCAVVVLNVTDPPRRLAQICHDVDPDLVVVGERYEGIAASLGVNPSKILMASEFATTARDLAPSTVHPPDDAGPLLNELAFLISTSGSTGRPKFVQQTHRNVLHNAFRYRQGLGITSEDRIAWLASLSGGQGVASVWGALSAGATLCPFPIWTRGIAGFADWLERTGVTVLDTVPSVFRSFVRTIDSGRVLHMRMVRLASEPAFRSDFDAFRAHFTDTSTLTTVLASSEAGIIADQRFDATSDPPDGRLSVGKATSDVEIRLLDESDNDVPDGESGQLVVRSHYLSPGYWRDDELTARRFVLQQDIPTLRTGDLAVRGPDGSLTVVGRADSQVKIRGHRLQLEEVEAALTRVAEVQTARVVAPSTARGDVRLTAFVVGRPGSRLDKAFLRAAVQDELPSHAMPTMFVVLDELPVTAHGKVDIERLTVMALEGQTSAGSIGSDTEEMVAALWCNAFGQDEVGFDEPFLTAGGDSLSAAEISAGVHGLFDVELDLQVFATSPTVSQLAAIVEQKRLEGLGVNLQPMPRATRGHPHALSSAQAQIWNRGAGSEGSTAWNVVYPFRVTGQLDVEVLRRSIEDVVRRHEILRTTFSESDDKPAAYIHDTSTVQLSLEDLRGSDVHVGIADAMVDEAHFAFDLRTGPSIRFRLLQVDDNEYVLLRNAHHLLSDASSWKVFFDELKMCYETRLKGETPPSHDEATLQYVDYAAWEWGWRTRDPVRFEAAVAYWRHKIHAPAPALELPFATLKSPSVEAGKSPSVAVLRWGLPQEAARQLDRVAIDARSTYYMSRLAPYAGLLGYEAAAGDLLIGTAVSMRSRQEIQRMFGSFTNFGLIRLSHPAERTFQSWLDHVRSVVIEMSVHAPVPFVQIAPELIRQEMTIPKVNAAFIAAYPMSAFTMGDAKIEPLERPCLDARIFRIGVNKLFEADRCWVEFDPLAHDVDGVRRFVRRLQAFISAVSAEPDRSMRELHAALPD